METPLVLALIITALPLASFTVQVFFGRFLPRQGDWLPTAAVAGGLGLSLFLFFTQVLANSSGMTPVMEKISWIELGTSSPLSIDLELFLDNMSVIMLVVVTLVSFLVHLFSMGYMKGEPRYNRFYAYLSPVHVLHARLDHHVEHPVPVHLLGARRSLLLPADRVSISRRTPRRRPVRRPSSPTAWATPSSSSAS